MFIYLCLTPFLFSFFFLRLAPTSFLVGLSSFLYLPSLLLCFSFRFVLFYSSILFLLSHSCALLDILRSFGFVPSLPVDKDTTTNNFVSFAICVQKNTQGSAKTNQSLKYFFFFANAFHLDKSIEMEMFVLKCEKSLKIRAATSAGCVIVSLSLAAFSVIFLKKFGIELGQFPSIEFKFQFSIFYASHMHNNAAENYQMQQQQHLHQPQQLN